MYDANVSAVASTVKISVGRTGDIRPRNWLILHDTLVTFNKVL